MFPKISSVSAKVESWAARREFEPFIAALEPTSGDMILDVGAGYGWIANRVGYLCKELLALEPDRKRSRQMLRNYPTLKIVSAVGEALPFRTSTFDKVYLRRSFHHMNDQEKALKEVGRVLKARGSILVQELTPERQGKLIKFAERWLRRAHVTFLNSADLDTKLDNEGFLVKLTKPAVAGYYLVAGKK